VQDYLELQQGIIPTMAETAFALKMPERTLRHQLQQLNTSYKQIREQIIKNKALKLMEYKEYSIEVIAEALGYSEPAALIMHLNDGLDRVLDNMEKSFTECNS
jgi:AraC-like DNA-binding protein